MTHCTWLMWERQMLSTCSNLEATLVWSSQSGSVKMSPSCIREEAMELWDCGTSELAVSFKFTASRRVISFSAMLTILLMKISSITRTLSRLWCPAVLETSNLMDNQCFRLVEMEVFAKWIFWHETQLKFINKKLQYHVSLKTIRTASFGMVLPHPPLIASRCLTTTQTKMNGNSGKSVQHLVAQTILRRRCLSKMNKLWRLKDCQKSWTSTWWITSDSFWQWMRISLCSYGSWMTWRWLKSLKMKLSTK